MNILFICSKNEWRSRTAETVFRDDPRFRVRSAGTSVNARIRVNDRSLSWADVVFVMEAKHRHLLRERHADAIIDKEIIVLDIPDEYRYMDAELVEELRETMDEYLSNQEDASFS